MRRLNHPVYRNRLGQILADAALVALAYFLAFQLRFLDDPHGWPHRYEVLFAQSVGFVVAGKLIIFAAAGLYQKWWRYVSGRDFLFIARAVAISSALLVIAFAVVQPFGHRLPRSVEVIDFMLTLILLAGARLLGGGADLGAPLEGRPRPPPRGARRRRRQRRPDGGPRAAPQPGP